MKKGQIYTGKVQYADFPNKAVVTVNSDNPEDNGKKVIVKNSIPGQTVRFMVNKKRKDKCEGRLLEVLEGSSIETNEKCKHFGQCGGCVYQSVAYDKQLDIKCEQIRKILTQAIRDEFEFEGIIGSPVSEEYRNKMEFFFGSVK